MLNEGSNSILSSKPDSLFVLQNEKLTSQRQSCSTAIVKASEADHHDAVNMKDLSMISKFFKDNNCNNLSSSYEFVKTLRKENKDQISNAKKMSNNCSDVS